MSQQHIREDPRYPYWNPRVPLLGIATSAHQVLLPQLSVAKDEPLHDEVLPGPTAEELALDPLSTLVPDLLVPPNKSQVRGWSSEDDHFEAVLGVGW